MADHYQHLLRHLCTLVDPEAVLDFLSSRPQLRCASTPLSRFSLLQDVASEHRVRGDEAMAQRVYSLARTAAFESVGVNVERQAAHDAMMQTREELEVELRAFRERGGDDATPLEVKRRKLDEQVEELLALQREMCVHTPYAEG